MLLHAPPLASLTATHVSIVIEVVGFRSEVEGT
jgi:hypothetical protein